MGSATCHVYWVLGQTVRAGRDWISVAAESAAWQQGEYDKAIRLGLDGAAVRVDKGEALFSLVNY